MLSSSFRSRSERVLTLWRSIDRSVGRFLFTDISYGWRYIYNIGVIPAIIMLFGCWYIPPSPRWLALRALQDGISVRARDIILDQARDSLAKIRGLSKEEVLLELSYKHTPISLSLSLSLSLTR